MINEQLSGKFAWTVFVYKGFACGWAFIPRNTNPPGWRGYFSVQNGDAEPFAVPIAHLYSSPEVARLEAMQIARDHIDSILATRK